MKKRAKTCPFLVKMAADFVLLLSPSKSSHFHFQTKNLFANKTAGGHFVSLPKTRFSTLGPQTDFFPKKCLKSCLKHFWEKSNIITITCILKILRKFCFKNGGAESAPPPTGLIGLNEYSSYSVSEIKGTIFKCWLFCVYSEF